MQTFYVRYTFYNKYGIFFTLCVDKQDEQRYNNLKEFKFI